MRKEERERDRRERERRERESSAFEESNISSVTLELDGKTRDSCLCGQG